MKKRIKKNKNTIIGIVAIALVILAAFLLIPSAGNGHLAKIETSMGDIVVELAPNEAPITVENFKSYIEEGFYDGLIFHRVIDNFMIQGGGFLPTGEQKKPNAPIKLESNNGLKNDEYTIAMARTNVPDSATSQFFINSNKNDFLNYAPGNPGYAVFGKVIEGKDVVDKIEKVQTSTRGPMQNWPIADVVIKKISLI